MFSLQISQTFIFVHSDVFEGDLRGQSLGLCLSPEGHLTGNLHLLLPPVRAVNLDLYTGWDAEFCLNFYFFCGDFLHLYLHWLIGLNWHFNSWKGSLHFVVVVCVACFFFFGGGGSACCSSGAWLVTVQMLNLLQFRRSTCYNSDAQLITVHMLNLSQFRCLTCHS